VHESFEVAEVPRARVLGLRVHDSPAGVMLEAKLTFPVNLYELTVIVELALFPATKVMFEGFADTVKSGAKLPTRAMTVLQSAVAVFARYSPETQNVELSVGLGSVPAPK
jgi:hypothetical protein